MLRFPCVVCKSRKGHYPQRSTYKPSRATKIKTNNKLQGSRAVLRTSTWKVSKNRMGPPADLIELIMGDMIVQGRTIKSTFQGRTIKSTFLY